MPTITTKVEIAATPEEVRSKFLDFSQIPNYSPNGFVRQIEPVEPKSSSEIKTGDFLNCVMGYGSMKFTPTVLENSSSVFSWRGSIPGLFVGDHSFRFESVKAASGTETTMFVQDEVFTGLLSFLMGDGLLANWAGQMEKTKSGFESYNKDFKAWVEKK
ncbi:activator of hsp90 ATPase 1 family protein [Phlyctema vagabunda]|uniref:Activator of hsp90 ATPase 1 family protein n=1 Tax=Phlyctema vagabunda TaxID=108571 RepID=A0ABR4PCS0_9HELO